MSMIYEIEKTLYKLKKGLIVPSPRILNKLNLKSYVSKSCH
jgi:hypothetical protein